MATIEQQQQARLTDLFGSMMERIARGEDIATPEARTRINEELEGISRGYGVAEREFGERMALKGREITPGMQAKFATQKLAGLSTARRGLEQGEMATAMQGMGVAGGYLQGLQRYNTKLAEMEASAAYQRIMMREMKKQREYGLWTGVGSSISGIAAASYGAKNPETSRSNTDGYGDNTYGVDTSMY